MGISTASPRWSDLLGPDGRQYHPLQGGGREPFLLDALLEGANRALGRLGAVRIAALTDTTASTKAVAACFPGVSDWVLRSWKWRFALNRVALTDPEAVEGTDWTLSYTLPPDCLEVFTEEDASRQVHPPGRNGRLTF